MKNIYTVIFISLFIGCAAEKKIVLNQEPKKIIQKKIKLDVFNGIIEDFEHGLNYWSKKSIEKNFITLYATDSGILNKVKNKIGVINYTIGYSTDYYKTYAILEYYKKMNFSKYKGIQFIARGNEDVNFRFKIYEMEEYKPGENIKEVWYYDFKADNNWAEYKLPFSRMQVEEYWEQNYVSDNQQIFTNIAGIAISVKNSHTPGYITGNLYIDDIKLY